MSTDAFDETRTGGSSSAVVRDGVSGVGRHAMRCYLERVQRSRRRVVLVAIALSVVPPIAVACGGTVASQGASGQQSDASSQTFDGPFGSAAPDSQPAASSNPTTCDDSAGGYEFGWSPPLVGAGACTSAELSNFNQLITGTNDASDTQLQSLYAELSSACDSCLFTVDSSTPFFQDVPQWQVLVLHASPQSDPDAGIVVEDTLANTALCYAVAPGGSNDCASAAWDFQQCAESFPCSPGCTTDLDKCTSIYCGGKKSKKTQACGAAESALDATCGSVDSILVAAKILCGTGQSDSGSD